MSVGLGAGWINLVQIEQQATHAADGGVIIDLTVNGTLTTYGDTNVGVGSLTLTG